MICRSPRGQVGELKLAGREEINSDGVFTI